MDIIKGKCRCQEIKNNFINYYLHSLEEYYNELFFMYGEKKAEEIILDDSPTSKLRILIQFADSFNEKWIDIFIKEHKDEDLKEITADNIFMSYHEHNADIDFRKEWSGIDYEDGHIAGIKDEIISPDNVLFTYQHFEERIKLEGREKPTVIELISHYLGTNALRTWRERHLEEINKVQKV